MMENPQEFSLGEETNFDKIVVHDAAYGDEKVAIPLICNVSNIYHDDSIINGNLPERTGIKKEIHTDLLSNTHAISNDIEKSYLFSIKKTNNDPVLVINVEEKELSEFSAADDTIQNLNDTKVVKSDDQEIIPSMNKTLEIEPKDDTLSYSNDTMAKKAVELENIQNMHKMSNVEPINDTSSFLNNEKVEKYVEQENILSVNETSDIKPIEEILLENLKNHDDALYMQTCIGKSEDEAFQNYIAQDQPPAITTGEITTIDNVPVKETIVNPSIALENPEVIVKYENENENDEIKNSFEDQNELYSIENQRNMYSNDLASDKLKSEKERNDVTKDYKRQRSSHEEDTFSKISGMRWLKSQNGTSEDILVSNNHNYSPMKSKETAQDPVQHSEIELKSNSSQECEVSKDTIGFDQNLNAGMKLIEVEKNSKSIDDNKIGFFNPIQEKTDSNPLKHEEKNSTPSEKCAEQIHSDKCEVSKDIIGSDKSSSEKIQVNDVQHNQFPMDNNIGFFNPAPEKTEIKPSKLEEKHSIQVQNLIVPETNEKKMTQEIQNQETFKPIRGRAGKEDNSNTDNQSKEKQYQTQNSSHKQHDQEKSSQNNNTKRDNSIDKKLEQQKYPHQFQDNCKSRPSNRIQNHSDKRDEINYKNRDNNGNDRYSYSRNDGNSYKNQDNYSRYDEKNGNNFKNQENYGKNSGNTGNSFKSQGNYGRNDGNRGDRYKQDYNSQESNTKTQNYDKTELPRKSESLSNNLKAPVNNIPFFNPNQPPQHHDSVNSKNQDRSSFACKSFSSDNSYDNNSKNRKSNTDREGDFKRRRHESQRIDGNSKQGVNQLEKSNQNKTLQTNINSNKLNSNNSACKTEPLKKISESESKHLKKESNTGQLKHEDVHTSKVNSMNQNVSSSLKKTSSVPRQDTSENMSHANQTKQVKFKDDANAMTQRSGHNDQVNKVKSTLNVDSLNTLNYVSEELQNENTFYVENGSMKKNIAGSQQTDAYHQLPSNEATFTETIQGVDSASAPKMYMPTETPTSHCNSSNMNNFGSLPSSSRSDWESNKMSEQAILVNTFMNLTEEYLQLKQTSTDLFKKQALVQGQMFALELSLRKLLDVIVPFRERTQELENLLSSPKYAPHGNLINLLNSHSLLTVPSLPMTGFNGTTASMYSNAPMVVPSNVPFADNSYASQSVPSMSVPNMPNAFSHPARSLPNFNQTASFDSHKNVTLHEHEMSNEELSLQQILGMQYHRNGASM